jgi:hypothetical protein
VGCELLVFERKVLRTICSLKIENNGIYRRRYLQEEVFRAKPNGRRNQGRPKSRWADGVNSDSLALGVKIGRTGLKTGSHGEIFFNRP